MVKEIISNNFNINVNKQLIVLETISNNFNINVNKTISVESITVHPKVHVLGLGDNLRLVTTILPVDATNQNVTWSSSNESIATVDPNGIVSALKIGDVAITCITEDGGFRDTCRITIVDLSTKISDVVVSDVANTGEYKLTYSASNFKDPMIHNLKIGSNNYIDISPTQKGNIFTYNGSGLSLGEYICYIMVSDGNENLTSSPFRIIVSEPIGGIKGKLKIAKDNYDASHNIFKIVIDSIINDGVYNDELEKDILEESQANYDEALANYNTVSQQCVDAIANKKANDAESNSNEYTKAQIQITSDSINSKVEKVEKNVANNTTRIQSAEQKITPDAITSTVSSQINNGQTLVNSSTMRFDKNGLTVSSSDANSKTHMTSGGFKIVNNTTGKEIFKVNSNGTLSLIDKLGEKTGMWVNSQGMQLGQSSLIYDGDRFVISSKYNLGLATHKNIYMMPSEYVSIDGRCQAKSFTLGETGNSAYLKYSTFYSPYIEENLLTYGVKLNNAIMVGSSNGNVHFITNAGGKSTIYANYNATYEKPDVEAHGDTKASDKLNQANVIDNKIIPINECRNNEIEDYVKPVSSNQYEINLNNTVALLWEANQELTKENAKLKEDQVNQYDKIISNMLATTELFEMMIAINPQGLNILTTNEKESDSKMVEVYVTLIIEGHKTIDEVPAIIRPKVIEGLK